MSTEAAEDGGGGGGEQEDMLVENTESVRQALRQAVANLSEPNEGGEEEEEEEEETDEASREEVEKKRKKVLECLKSDSVPWKVVLEAMRINRKALAKRKNIDGEAEADGKEDGFWELSIQGLREANAGIDNATPSSAGRVSEEEGGRRNLFSFVFIKRFELKFFFFFFDFLSDFFPYPFFSCCCFIHTYCVSESCSCEKTGEDTERA